MRYRSRPTLPTPLPPPPYPSPGRLVVRGGRVVDPAQAVDAVKDVAAEGGHVREVADAIHPDRADRVINAEGLIVAPGLVDIHCHIYDLFDVSTAPGPEAVASGTTVALTPGAGNTFMAPALLGAEVDRGLPLHVGCYLGAAAVLGCRASLDELVAYFRGELSPDDQLQVISRNPITNATGALAVGIKDHMGHWILSDEALDACFELTTRAGLVFMSHCQDPEHAERLVRLGRGRRVLLTHATASGSGSHGDAVESLERVLALARAHPNVTVDFVSAHLRRGRGLRDGLLIEAQAQELALRALGEGLCRILVSDGPCSATMKGFGDARENVPCLLELSDAGMVSLSQAVAAMTANPVSFLAEVTGQEWWHKELGHLGPGARANVVLIDPSARRAVMTIVDGQIAAFEGRPIREANGCGGWVSRTGLLRRTGVGDLPLFQRRIEDAPVPGGDM